MPEQTLSKIFADNLTRILEERKISTAEFAEKIGVSTATVSYWKKGEKSPRPEKVDAICDYLGIEQELLYQASAKAENLSLAIFLEENPEYQPLVKAVLNVKKEDIPFITKMIERTRIVDPAQCYKSGNKFTPEC